MPNTIAANVRAELARAGVNRGELATVLDVSRTTVSRHGGDD